MLVNIYRSPSENVDKFIDALDDVLRSLDRHKNKQTLLTGDLNIDLIKFSNDCHCQNLISVFEKYGLVQLVSRPTRVTDHSATLIDHVYTNDVANVISCNVLTTDISDHLAVLTTITLGQDFNQRKRRGHCSCRLTITHPWLPMYVSLIPLTT